MTTPRAPTVASSVASVLSDASAEAHVREIARRVGHSAAAVGRALRRLEAEGIVTSRWVGRSRVYRRTGEARFPDLARRLASASFDPNTRPYFLWDIDLSWSEFAAYLKSADQGTRRWALERLLNDARWRDIWALVTPAEVREQLPSLRVRFKDVYQAVVDAAGR